jgi:hypothetical protein
MKQLNALELADILMHLPAADAAGHAYHSMAQIELRRLHEANQAMLEALKDIKHGLEGSRIWGGMEWTYNPLHPFKYLPLVEKASAGIAKGDQS